MAQQYSGQSDAATMRPRLVPAEALMPRDNSGGADGDKFQMSSDFGDAGKNTVGSKPYLKPGGD